jgi:hypothetical protein
MNPLENYWVDVNICWVYAKFLPFLFILLFSLLLFYFFQKKIVSKNKILVTITCFIFLVIPFSSYFYFFPVYRGDIFDLAEKPQTSIKFSKNKKLVIFVLPDCSYCHESKFFIEKLIKRNPTIEIEIWICGIESDSYYESIKSQKLKIRPYSEFNKIISLTQGIFPTYAISEKQKLVNSWTNQSFGARSLDEIEAFFEVHK